MALSWASYLCNHWRFFCDVKRKVVENKSSFNHCVLRKLYRGLDTGEYLELVRHVVQDTIPDRTPRVVDWV